MLVVNMDPASPPAAPVTMPGASQLILEHEFDGIEIEMRWRCSSLSL